MADDTVPRALAQSFAAVRELALGLGGLQARLEGACDALLSLESKEIPDPLREEFRGLIGDIMDIEELDRLADAAATALALRILTLHERLILGR